MAGFSREGEKKMEGFGSDDVQKSADRSKGVPSGILSFFSRGPSGYASLGSPKVEKQIADKSEKECDDAEGSAVAAGALASAGGDEWGRLIDPVVEAQKKDIREKISSLDKDSINQLAIDVFKSTDEAIIAESICSKIGLNHKELDVSYSDLFEIFSDCFEASLKSSAPKPRT